MYWRRPGETPRKQGKGLDALKPTLNILKEYTKMHFKTEEALMENADYPEFEDHLTLHEGLMNKSAELTREALSDKEPELALKFL